MNRLLLFAVFAAQGGILYFLNQTKKEMLQLMKDNKDLAQQANEKLDVIDRRTNEEADQVRAVVEGQKAEIERLKAEGSDTSALEQLNARLDRTADNIQKIYSADTGETGESIGGSGSSGSGSSGSGSTETGGTATEGGVSSEGGTATGGSETATGTETAAPIS